jgi:hypothetical protein
MKPQNSFLFLALTLCAACNGVTGDPMSVPVVVVDELHSQFAKPDGSEPSQYSVTAGPAIELDASTYSFPVKADYGLENPNIISVVMGRDRRYRMAWSKGVSKYTLSAATLTPELGSVPFAGFRSGETFGIMVGFEDSTESKPSAVSIKLLWGGLVTVK